MINLRKASGVLMLVLWINLFALPAAAQTSGIEFFHGTWEEVLKEAKKERKLVFVDAYTTWCGPCKMMARNTFTNEEVGKYYNNKFVNYKFDMEKGEGPTFAGKYGVRAYPTLFFINYKGEVVHKTLGFRNPDQLLAEGREAMDPAKNAANLELDYKAGNMEAEKLYAYAMKLKKSGENFQEPASKYFAALSTKELKTKSGWEAIRDLSTDVEGPEFAYLLKKQKKFKKVASPAEVDNKIATVFKRNVLKAALSKDAAAYKKIQGIAQTQTKDKGKTAARIAMTYAEANKDWNEYAKAAINFFENFSSTDHNELNNVAWNFYLHVDDRDQVNKALDWSRQSVALRNQYYNNDTYAALLYKSGRYDEAFKIANKAISIAQENDENYKGTEELLQKIKTKLN